MYRRIVPVTLTICILSLTVSAGILYPEPAQAVPASVTNCATSVVAAVVAQVITSSIAVYAGLRYASFYGGPQPTLDASQLVKTAIFDSLSRCAARIVHDAMISGMLDVVRKQGRDGGSSFVKNWRNFMTGSEHRGENIGKAVIANTELCDHFKGDIRAALGVSNRDNVDLSGQNIRSGGYFDPFTLRSGCSLPQGFNLEAFRDNFALSGGWNTINMLSRPENNFFDTYQSAKEELDMQRAIEVATDYTDAAVAGRGYASIRGKDKDASCKLKGLNDKCLVYQDIKSPGSYAAGVTDATINSELRWVDNIHTVSELIANALAQRVTQRLQNLGSDEGAVEQVQDPTPAPVSNGCTGDDPNNAVCYAKLPTLRDCANDPSNLLCQVDHPSECWQPSDSPSCIVYLPELSIWPLIQARQRQ